MVRLRRLGTEYGRGGRCCLLVLADRFLCQVRCDAILSREPTFSARMGDNIEESEQTEVGAPSEPAEASVAEEESSAADPNELDEKDASERKRKNEDEQATAEEGAAEVESPPPRKKRSKSSGSAKKQKALEVVRDPNDKYPFARDRGIRIFSDREIDVQDAQLTRDYWRFWNDTAEELCSNRAYNDWGKRDLKLYIDAAWIIHKTYLQENVEKELAESLKEVQEKHGYEELPHKLKSQDEAVTTSLSKLQDSTANLHELNLELSRFRGKLMNVKQRPVGKDFPADMKEEETRKMMKELGEHEKNLYNGMTEVKRDQDSLKKALNRLKTMVNKIRQSAPTRPVS